jgi:hypothetical protein
MSEGNGLNFSKLTIYLFGAIFLAAGLMLTYFSLGAGVDIISPRLFTPIAVLVSIVGLVMFIVKVE